MTTPRDAAFQPLNPAPRFPALAWRNPAPVWIAMAMILAAGWPAVLIDAGLGMTLAVLISTLIAVALALATAAWLFHAGRPLRARRDIVLLCLGYGLACALIAPGAFAFFSGAAATDGYTSAMTAALWPLAVALGAPIALFAGLATALVAFRKPPQIEPDVLVAQAASSTDLSRPAPSGLEPVDG